MRLSRAVCAAKFLNLDPYQGGKHGTHVLQWNYQDTMDQEDQAGHQGQVQKSTFTFKRRSLSAWFRPSRRCQGGCKEWVPNILSVLSLEWQRVAASYFHAFTWFCTRVDKSEAVWNSMDENTRCVKVCMVVKYWLSHTLAQNCLIELWSGTHLTCKNTLTRWTWIWYGIFIGNEHRLWQQK